MYTTYNTSISSTVYKSEISKAPNYMCTQSAQQPENAQRDTKILRYTGIYITWEKTILVK